MTLKVFSNFKQLSLGKAEYFVIELIDFFAPSNANKYREILGLSVYETTIQPLSINDFFKYMEKVKSEKNIYQFMSQIKVLVKKLEQCDFLSYAGSLNSFSSGGEKCYYTIGVLTPVQKKNSFWLGEFLGFEFVNFRMTPFVIPVTGVNLEGDTSIGTGTLINNNTILTCGHVVSDMKIDGHIQVNGKNIAVTDWKVHENIDIGIIRLKENVELGDRMQIPFSDAYVLEDILTMGYPPVPMSKDAYLISQKGEINSFVENYNGITHMIYSSITRPGNSGGPIFSKRGYLVGLSARHLEVQKNQEGVSSVIPFYEGIPSQVIINALREIEPKIDILIEDSL